MTINYTTTHYTTSSHGFSTENPSGNPAGEKTAEGISVVPREEVSPLVALPDELLLNITNYLPLDDIRRLALTNRRLSGIFNTEEKLEIISGRLFGTAVEAYRKNIEHRAIPPVPNLEINDPLLRLAYHRVESNTYLSALGSNTQQQCVATLNGHTAWVRSVTPLADGRLASCSHDQTVKVWDLSKPDGQQCVATLNGHTDWVRSVTPLADGRLVSYSNDRTVKVWDLSKPDGQQCVATLNGHTAWVRSVTPLADGRLASCSHDRTVKVWDLSKPDGQQCVATLNGHTDWVSSVTPLADGRLAS